MKRLQVKIQWALTHAALFLAGIIVMIDPKHIDAIADKHPQWTGIIMAIWAALLAWANRERGQVTEPSQQAVTSKPPGKTN